ncbi:MAG: alpha/beta fold hydrolase [Verrucomicrobia bacterium]|nr:alpha/beta fold hydrolase [Cytophagales bacterium]
MDLHFRQIGQGSPMIILHGLLGSSDNWLTIAKTFAENYSVFIIDQRNHGHSPWSKDWDYVSMSQDLKDFIDSQQLSNPILIGHSMGGKTVMNYATHFQSENFSKLIVVDIAPKFYNIDYSDYLEGMQSLDLEQTMTRQQAETHLLPFAPDFGVRQFLLKNLYRDENGKFAWRPNLKIIAENIQNVGQPLPENARTEKPALFIRGEKSDYVLDSDWTLIQKYFPNANLETVAGAGHWVQAEQPEAFIKTTLTWLNSH